MKNANFLGTSVKISPYLCRNNNWSKWILQDTGCFYPDCYVCESGGKGGASHTKSGAHYSAICKLCAEKGVNAIYNGESGRSAYFRSKQHKSDIANCRTSNALAKHLEIYHKNDVGNRNVPIYVYTEDLAKLEDIYR